MLQGTDPSRNFFEYLGEQRRKRREREARVASRARGKEHEKNYALFFSRSSSSARLCSPKIRKKFTPVLQAIGPQNGKGGDARQFFKACK